RGPHRPPRPPLSPYPTLFRSPGADLGVEADAVVEQLLPLTTFDDEARVLRHRRRGGVVRAVAQLEPMDAEAIVQMVDEAPQGRRGQSGASCGGIGPVGYPRARMAAFDPGGHDIADDAPAVFDDEGKCTRGSRCLGAVDVFDPGSGAVVAAIVGDVAGQVRIGAGIALGQLIGVLGPPGSQNGVHPPTLPTHATSACSADSGPSDVRSHLAGHGHPRQYDGARIPESGIRALSEIGRASCREGVEICVWWA